MTVVLIVSCTALSIARALSVVFTVAAVWKRSTIALYVRNSLSIAALRWKYASATFRKWAAPLATGEAVILVDFLTLLFRGFGFVSLLFL